MLQDDSSSLSLFFCFLFLSSEFAGRQDLDVLKEYGLGFDINNLGQSYGLI